MRAAKKEGVPEEAEIGRTPTPSAVFREVIRGSLPRQLFSSGILDLSDLPRQPSVACSASMFREQPGIFFDKHVFRGSSADVFRAHCFLRGFLSESDLPRRRSAGISFDRISFR